MPNCLLIPWWHDDHAQALSDLNSSLMAPVASSQSSSHRLHSYLWINLQLKKSTKVSRMKPSYGKWVQYSLSKSYLDISSFFTILQYPPVNRFFGPNDLPIAPSNGGKQGWLPKFLSIIWHWFWRNVQSYCEAHHRAWHPCLCCIPSLANSPIWNSECFPPYPLTWNCIHGSISSIHSPLTFISCLQVAQSYLLPSTISTCMVL